MPTLGADLVVGRVPRRATGSAVTDTTGCRSTDAYTRGRPGSWSGSSTGDGQRGDRHDGVPFGSTGCCLTDVRRLDDRLDEMSTTPTLGTDLVVGRVPRRATGSAVTDTTGCRSARRAAVRRTSGGSMTGSTRCRRRLHSGPTW
jgi:hypothetical protein